jgi:germination protein M
MLKRRLISKILMTTIALCSLFMLTLIPKSREYRLENVETKTVYDEEKGDTPVYLIDQYNYVARTVVKIENDPNIENKIKKLLEVLIVESDSEKKVPNGFKAIIPSDTKVLSVGYDKHSKTAKINFSEELLDVSKNKEEKMIEAIVYTVTTIKDVENIIIYVEEVPLTTLPKTGIHLPSTLNRNYGINKEYDFTSLNDINDITVYYINKYNEDYYYVPVTKYVNDNEDKIKIIIDELASGPSAGTNLMSFLNSNTEILSSSVVGDTLELTFNDYIFDDIKNKKILEEVIYTICLSIADNYDVKEVSFNVSDKQIYKSVLKTIE